MREKVYISAYLSNVDKKSGISEWDTLFPYTEVVNWFRERYFFLSSFEFYFDWRKTIFRGRPVFVMIYDSEEVITYFKWSRHDYERLRKDGKIFIAFYDILHYGDPFTSHPMYFNNSSYYIYSYVIDSETTIERYESDEDLSEGSNLSISKIEQLSKKDQEIKNILFQELIEKTWHPDRVMKWCICE
jgi:hypothetical protein